MWLTVQCPGSRRPESSQGCQSTALVIRSSRYHPPSAPPILKGFRTFTICIILDIVEVYATAPPVFLQQVTLSATQVDLTALEQKTRLRLSPQTNRVPVADLWDLATYLF